MGFLDDLKRQADALKAQQGNDSAALARNAALTEATCKGAFDYLNTLRDQLDLLQPVSPARFVLDRQHVFAGVKLSDFRIDARRKPLRDQDVHDFIVLHWQLKTGRVLELTKDFVPDIEKLEPRLRQSGANVEAEAMRNPDNGKLLGMRYRFVADFRGSLRITPDHDSTRMHIQLNNLDGFESVSVEFPAIELGSARLDELARWLAGAPHAFLQDGQALRRVEA
ncbi:MAG TPA: hypothetical protein VF169_05645 [Albitalea sp.]|uniref:hypothetical protein n=1 Tax=Piscinibacter sp. TaxID=1903157 RepID=UPI002ED23E02